RTFSFDISNQYKVKLTQRSSL
ncbi:hypothetical protein J7Z48_RS24550, partial [Escherichia coli]